MPQLFSRHSIGFLFLFLLPLLSLGQFYDGLNMNFGKNRVQWGQSIWFFYRFDQFDTYFYLNGEELAQYTAQYAEEQVPILERKLQTAITEKIQFVVFNSLSDLKQSNLGLAANQQYNTGGVTHILGNKIILYFDGNYLQFEQQIRAGIADILIQQLMYGGSLVSQMRNSVMFNLPDWYKMGLLSYFSQDWNTTIDSRMQEGILSGRFRKPNHLKDEDAMIAGHAFWRYIEQQFGAAAIPDIIHMTQVSRNIQNSFYYITGLKFKKLMKNWLEYYKNFYSQKEQSLPYQTLPLKYRTYRNFNRPEISPDERYLSYTTNDEGLVKLWLLDLQTHKKKRLFKAGYRTDEKIDASFPLTAWHPSGDILAFILEEKGEILLHFYNITDKSIDVRNMFDFQKITHISYAENGRQLVMSAVRKGKPDIYVFDLASNSHIQITDDYFTDLYPVFAEKDSKIIFSSNRTSDTLSSLPEKIIQNKHFNLYSYDYRNRSNILRRLTDTPLSDEIKAVVSGHNSINYLSDANGWYNIYSGQIDSTIAFVDTAVHYRYYMESAQLTDFTTQILDYSSQALTDSYFFVARQNNRQKIFRIDTPPQVDTDVSYSDFMQEQQKLLQQETQPASEPVIQRKSFRSLFRPAIFSDSLQLEPLPARQGAFGISGRQRLSLLNQGKEAQDQRVRQTPKRRNYLVEYFFDQLVTQLDFTYLNQSYQPFTGGGSPIYLNPGLNAFLGVNLTDLLENYRISAGIRLSPSLTNNEYVLSFSNMKDRLDKTITLYRQSIGNFGDTTKIFSYQALYMLSWPFKETLSLRSTAIYRNDLIVFLAQNDYSLKKPNTHHHWAGLRTELVYDNTREIGLNLLVGLRGKLFGEYFQLINAKAQNLIVTGFDLRHYTRIHRNFIWANRVAGSVSTGTSKLIYYMGGVDNWMMAKFNQETPIDYTQNYAYQTLATNMRGFHQNIRNGNTFAVINTELRFPVFSYLLTHPISTAFIRNFQLTAFGDIGTAWTGWNPYDPSNALYTRHIYSGPMHITVEIQKEPIVGGMGLGARTTLLGYFVRADIAWGIEDHKINKPVFYISLNLDF
jgi:Tol biopolymer transport system component